MNELKVGDELFLEICGFGQCRRINYIANDGKMYCDGGVIVNQNLTIFAGLCTKASICTDEHRQMVSERDNRIKEIRQKIFQHRI